MPTKPVKSYRRAGPAILTIALAAVAVGSTQYSDATTKSSASVSGSAGTPSNARGVPLWVESLRTLDASQARHYLTGAGFAATGVRHGVRLYRVVYRTVDPNGDPTTASGLLALPVGGAHTLTTVSFAHGTTSYRGDAPSSLPPDGFASAPAVAYASAGYAAVAPDYLGLGVGPGAHPWFHLPSETTASLDLLRATRDFTAAGPVRLNGDVLVSGFSQGASAALGLGRALAGGADAHFRLRAVAPMSGAYAFRGVELPAALDGGIAGPIAVPYLSYLLTAYDRVYDVYRSPSDVFRQPYADRVETLFNSDVPGKDMLQALPQSPGQLLTTRGLQLLRHPAGGLAAGLANADAVCDWHTTVPVRLYYADKDEQAVNRNTANCAMSLQRNGTHPSEVDLGTPEYAGSRHLGSAVAGVASTLEWFERIAPAHG